MRSLECCTSEPKRASLRRRCISSVSAMLSSASATWVASARSAASTDGAGRPGAVTTSRLDAPRRGLISTTVAASGPGSEPRRGARRVIARGCEQLEALVVADAAEQRRGRFAGERARRVHRDVVDLRAARRAHERGAGGREHPLARERSLLLADQPGHAHDDEAEERDRRARHHDHVEVARWKSCTRLITGATSDAHVSSASRKRVSIASRRGDRCSIWPIDGCSAAAPHKR